MGFTRPPAGAAASRQGWREAVLIPVDAEAGAVGEVLGDRNVGDSAAGSVAASPIVVLLSLCRETAR